MAATITNLAGDNVSYTTAGTTAVLDGSANALLSGITVADLKGGKIKVHFDSGGAATDTLSLAYGTSFAVGTVTLFMGQLYVNALGTGAYSVGTASGGTAGSDLTITFNNTNNVTLEAAQVLLRSLSFKTTAAGTPERTISVTVIDRNTVAGTAAVVTVNAVAAAPTDITLSASAVAENTSTTSALDIGTLASVDANKADTHSYSVVGGADQAVFQVSNGTLQFKAGTVLDHENQHSYTVAVRSTDSASLTYDKTLTVTLTDVNEAPVLAVNTGTSLMAGASTVIGSDALKVTDVDNNAAQLTYTLQDAPVNGTLALGANVLKAHASFTQTDVDSGQLKYTHQGAGGNDAFGFTVSDGAGGTLAQSTFSLGVTAQPPEPVPQTVVVMGTKDFDSRAMPGSLDDYAVTRGQDGLMTVRKISDGSTVVLHNFERIAFADMSVNLAVAQAASALEPVALDNLVALYIAFFNRAPEADGMAFWIGQYQGGRTLESICESFYSAALQYSDLTGYDPAMSNGDFVTRLYQNALGRTSADAEGMAYWSQQLAGGDASRGVLVDQILRSARALRDDPTWGYVASFLDDRVKTGRDFAIDRGLGYNSPYESISQGMALVGSVTPDTSEQAVRLIGQPQTVDFANHGELTL